jgi:hypothetical protein
VVLSAVGKFKEALVPLRRGVDLHELEEEAEVQALAQERNARRQRERERERERQRERERRRLGGLVGRNSQGAGGEEGLIGGEVGVIAQRWDGGRVVGQGGLVVNKKRSVWDNRGPSAAGLCGVGWGGWGRRCKRGVGARAALNPKP